MASNSQNYINDEELTKILIRDRAKKRFNEDGSFKPPLASDELGEMFLKIVEKVLTRGNFRGYSEEYKNELRGSANIFFASYWWKFNERKVQYNVLFQESKKKYQEAEGISDEELKELPFKDLPDEYKVMKPEEEWKGAFSYFSTLIFSGFLGGLKSLNKPKPLMEEAVNKTSTVKDDIASEYYSRGLYDDYEI